MHSLLTVRPSEEFSNGVYVGMEGQNMDKVDLHSVEFEEQEEAAEEESGEPGGLRVPVRVHDPKMPTETEQEEHCLMHVPYRSWCVHCVRGRGEQKQHKRQERDKGAITEIHMD